MKEKLKISDDLSLPIEAVTETLGWLGRRGSGKSYGASKLAEEMHRLEAQFVVLDPVGIWYGLRLAADGKSPGLAIPVLGGLHGDIPLEATGGALIADMVVDRGASVVLDVSQFESDADKAKFARAFADRFFFRKKAQPSAVHVFIEECQEFVPQNPQREEAQMLHAFTRMAKIGRNFGIGLSLISQRPQEVNKKVLNLTELLFAFQLTGPQERKTLQGWIADKGIDEDIEGILPKLERGAPHAWSPAWLKISRVVQIGKKWTFDASSTPKVGKEAAARTLSPIDLDQLRVDMAATIEKAKAEDPRLLRQQIADLKRQLAARPAAEKIVEKVVEVPVLKNGQLDRTEKIFSRMQEHGDKFLAEAAELRRLIAPAAAPRPAPRPAVRAPLPVRREPVARPSAPIEGVSRAQQRVLDSLAALEGMGIQQPSKEQLALWSEVSPTSGGYFNNLGALRSLGLIDYPSGGLVQLTDAGRKAAQPSEPLSVEEMQESLCRKVGSSKAAIVRALIDMYPKSIAKDALAEKIGVSPTSGGYFNNLGALRTLGVIDYPTPGAVAALPVLFLES